MSSNLNLSHRRRRALAYAPNFSTTDSADSHAQLQVLHGRLEQFTQTLPRLGDVDPTHTERIRDLLVIHTLCYCAMLQLHAPSERPLILENSKSLTAANTAADILRVVDVSRLHFVDPILGVSF